MKEFIKNHKALTVSLSAILAVIILAGVGILAILPHGGKVAAGVSTDGINLGGMTKEEIIATLEESDCYDGISLTFKEIPGEETVSDEPVPAETVSGEDIGLSVDAEATAEKAIAYGRYAGLLNNIKNAVLLRFEPVDFAPVAKVDREKLGEIIYSRGLRKNGEMKNVEQELLSETELLLKPAWVGQDTDVEEEIDYVLSMVEKGRYEIELELPQERPEYFTVGTLAEYVNIEPVNAEYRVEDNKIYITDGTVGIKLADPEIEQKVADLNAGFEVVVTVESIQPEITADSINGELFGAELSNYSSSYATSTANRAYNVARAAASINGRILMPGEVFSYNAAIGNPSLANGYKMATVFANGKQTEGVGGGVCQVSSTLYSAVLYADLEIVERRSHSLLVTYVPKGQDATVVYGGQDFKFKNNTNSPIKIEATASRGVCKVRILGAAADANKKVEIVNSINSKVSPTVIETLDESLPAGTRKVTSSGKTGYKVSSVRIVYENGKEVKRERLTNSSYSMSPTEVTVGPSPTEEPSVPVVAPTEEPTASPPPEPTAEPSPSNTPTLTPAETPEPTPPEEPVQTLAPTPNAPTSESERTPDTENLE